MATPAQYTGSCLCTSITLTVASAPLFHHVCHCTSCQKYTGSAFVTGAIFPATSLTVNDPKSALRTYVDTSPNSGSAITRYFCGTCSSGLFCKNEGHEAKKAFVTVMQGVLDVGENGKGRDGLEPQAEFFVKRKVGWLGDVRGAKGFEEMAAPKVIGAAMVSGKLA